jgi:hypothetical protein
MGRLGDIVPKIRSKNAGPFWLTIDLFCGDADVFERVKSELSTGQVADALDANHQEMKRFDIADLNVIKFSVPRPHIQGAVDDRDMHGASWAALIADLSI